MILWGAGLVLFLLGWLHRWDPVRRAETRFLQQLQAAVGRPPWLGFFQEIWLLGRTTFTLLVLGLILVLDWQKGAAALITYGAAVGLERGIKLAVDRQRPFQAEAGIQMHQLRKPRDPSFPSGDSLRIWFLVPVLTSVLGLPPGGQLVLIVLAGLVALGRSVLGVHYPTDVAAGTGLGLLGGALTLYTWQMISWLQ